MNVTQRIETLHRKALQVGFTPAGWTYLILEEMGIRPGTMLLCRERHLLTERAHDPEWAAYCNKKAAGDTATPPGLSITELFE